MGKEVEELNKSKDLALAAVMTALTALGGWIRIPLGFTSLTLQTFFTALAGLLLPPKWAMASQGVYVALGLLGLPLFTQGGGLGYIFQPTFGFLLATLPAVGVISYLSRIPGSIFSGRKPSVPRGGGSAPKPPGCPPEPSGPSPAFSRVAAPVLTGFTLMYAGGLPYMALILRVYLCQNISFWAIFRTGFLLCLPGDLVKILLLFLLFPRLKKSIK